MKQLKPNTKKFQSGITLIALVITIIVLLILAGVSIATLTGENGILTRANDARAVSYTHLDVYKRQGLGMPIVKHEVESSGITVAILWVTVFTFNATISYVFSKNLFKSLLIKTFKENK